MATRGNPNFLLQLEKHLEIPPSMRMRPYSPAVTRKQSRTPPCNSNGDLTSLRQHERLPEFPVITDEESQASRSNSRKTMRFPPQRELRPFAPAAPRKHSQIPSHNLKGGLTPFMQLQSFPKIPITTQRKPEVPAITQVKPHVPHLILR